MNCPKDGMLMDDNGKGKRECSICGYKQWRRVVKIEFNKVCSSRLQRVPAWVSSLLIFCSCGFAGSIIDADHFTKIITTGEVITKQGLGSREYHVLYFLAFCLVLLSCTSLIYRLYALVVEEKRKYLRSCRVGKPPLF